MDLGNTINSIRKQKGIRQGELADRIGLTQTYLSQIENNKRDPNLATLKKIGDALSMPLPILFFLALDESDIPERKKVAFKLIGPSVKSMLSEFFVSDLFKNDKV